MEHTIRESGIKLQGERVILKSTGKTWKTVEAGVLSLSAGGPSGEFDVSTVEAVGVDIKFVKVGDYVVHMPLIGTGFTYNGEKYIAVKEEGIAGIVPAPTQIKL